MQQVFLYKLVRCSGHELKGEPPTLRWFRAGNQAGQQLLPGPTGLQGQRQGPCSHAGFQLSMGRNPWSSCTWAFLSLSSVSPPVSAKYARAGQNLQLPALEGSLESQLTRSTVTVRPCVTSGWSVRRWWQAAGHNQEKQSFFLRVKALGRWRDEEAQSQATSAAAALRAEGLERLWEGLLASCVFHIGRNDGQKNQCLYVSSQLPGSAHLSFQ